MKKMLRGILFALVILVTSAVSMVTYLRLSVEYAAESEIPEPSSFPEPEKSEADLMMRLASFDSEIGTSGDGKGKPLALPGLNHDLRASEEKSQNRQRKPVRDGNPAATNAAFSEEDSVSETDDFIRAFASLRERGDLERWMRKTELSEELRDFFDVDEDEVRSALRYEELMALSPQVVRIGIYLEDMRSGKVFTCNADADFYAASTRKLGICSVAMRMVRDGKMRLKDEVAFLPEWDSEGGAGVIQKNPVPGSLYSVRTLIEYIGHYSDNIALNMLVRKMIHSGGKEYYAGEMERVTGRTYEDRNYYTPRQLAQSVKSVCVGYSETPLFEVLIKAMEDVEENEYVTKNMPRGSFFQKSGLFFGEDGINSTHEIGVVYGEYPVLFSVMTEWVGSAEEMPYELMHRISKVLYFLAETEFFPAR